MLSKLLKTVGLLAVRLILVELLWKNRKNVAFLLKIRISNFRQKFELFFSP